MNRPRQNTFWFLLLAGLFHVWVGSRQLPPTLVFKVPADPTAPVVIEKLSDLPVVQTERGESHPSKDKARFSGEFEQRVEKETRSPRSGQFRAGGRIVQMEPDREASDEGEMSAAKPKLKDLMALSSTPNALPDDVALGEDTILSTDSVNYASFINRIADEIVGPWEDRARRAVESIYIAGGKLIEQRYITRLAISLDLDGNVIAIQTLKSSGFDALDEAPKQAIWDRDPYINPPKQAQTEEGPLRFVFEFCFEHRTSMFSIVPKAI